LTIFFSDIRGFTSLSEKLREEQVVEMLNTYLSRMVNIIFENEGTLDKFIGDAVVAFWGAPLKHDDDHYRAVKSALAMIDALKDINRNNRKNNLPELAIGIGIHTGSVILGNIGSEKKLDYTIIGDNVNLTSRLEGLSKNYRCSIIISGETCNHVRDRILCRIIDNVVVKGKNKPVLIYSALGHLAAADPASLEIAALSQKAFDLYQRRQFAEAEACYEKILKIRPDDYLAAMLMERNRGYLREPPPADWNGAYVLTSK
jgi:adenylate cyclase